MVHFYSWPFTCLWIVFFAVWLAWGCYGLMMAILRAHNAGTLTSASRFFAFTWLPLFLLADVIFNWFIASLIFLDLPRELLTTQRMARYYKARYAGTKRSQVAHWLCQNLLDPLDPTGRHCR